MQAADSCIAERDFRCAQNYYNAAKVYCRDSVDRIDRAKDALFTRINNLRVEADSLRFTAEGALAQAQQLIDAFYFFGDRFALAFKDDQFYYIDKNGQEIEKLGRWEEAELFDTAGLATVAKQGNTYLMDTLGNLLKEDYKIESKDDHYIKLVIGENDSLTALSGTLNNLVELEELYLEELPALQQLSDSFGNFPNLKYLSISKTGLQKLPTGIGQLNRLRTLQLKFNESLIQLPTSIGRLSQLRHLIAPYNNLGPELPESIGALGKLQRLELQYNKLNSLPPSIGDLQQLIYLNLENNDLLFLPPEIGQLKKLEVLILNDNDEIAELPKTIGQLHRLRHLDLSSMNALASLPESIAELERLEYLNISSPKLKDLPTGIKDLTQLDTLHIQYDKDADLDIIFQNLNALKWLSLTYYTLFDQQPPPIQGIQYLDSLVNLRFIGEFDFSTLVSQVNGLSNLKQLSISHCNSIKKLPMNVGKLDQLERLAIIAIDSLISVPKSIGELSGLKALVIRWNPQLQKLPSSLTRLTALRELRLPGNALVALPKDIGVLKSLQWLDLSENQLSALPSSIINLLNLRRLDLRGNSIPKAEIENLQRQLINCKINY